MLDLVLQFLRICEDFIATSPTSSPVNGEPPKIDKNDSDYPFFILICSHGFSWLSTSTSYSRTWGHIKSHRKVQWLILHLTKKGHQYGHIYDRPVWPMSQGAFLRSSTKNYLPGLLRHTSDPSPLGDWFTDSSLYGKPTTILTNLSINSRIWKWK